MRANRCAVDKTLGKTENAGGYAGTPRQSPPAHPEHHAPKKERQIVCKRQAKGNASTQLFALGWRSNYSLPSRPYFHNSRRKRSLRQYRYVSYCVAGLAGSPATGMADGSSQADARACSSASVQLIFFNWFIKSSGWSAGMSSQYRVRVR